MSKYRIIEKKGHIQKGGACTTPMHCVEYEAHVGSSCTPKYIPRFIVQEMAGYYPGRSLPADREQWNDLKEFTSLEDARAYKRDLELEDGTVIE